MSKRKDIPAGHKKCSRCREIKAFEAFGYDKSKLDGHDSYCKGCRRDFQRERRNLMRNASKEIKQGVYASLTGIERNALKKTVTAKALLSSLQVGKAITLRLRNGKVFSGCVTGSSPNFFAVSGTWGSNSYTLAEVVMGDVDIVKRSQKGATKEPCVLGDCNGL